MSILKVDFKTQKEFDSAIELANKQLIRIDTLISTKTITFYDIPTTMDLDDFRRPVFHISMVL